MARLSVSAWLDPAEAGPGALGPAAGRLEALYAFPGGGEARAAVRAEARRLGMPWWPSVAVRDDLAASLAAARAEGAAGLILEAGPDVKARLGAVSAAGLPVRLGAAVRAGERPELPPGADRVQLRLVTPEGPRLPRAAVDALLDVALERYPAERVEFALPFLERGADGLERPGAEGERRGPERRDPRDGEILLPGGGRRIDALAATAKLADLRSRGVRRVAVWRLGAEDPRLWSLFDTLPEAFL